MAVNSKVDLHIFKHTTHDMGVNVKKLTLVK